MAGVAKPETKAPPIPFEPPSLEKLAAAFPQLEILELVGLGGMGAVYKARQPKLERLVALKVLPEALGQDPSFAERFGREAKLLARLNHPNIVTIYDYGQSNGFCYLLMEYVDGVSLRQAMEAGRFSPTAVLSMVPRICEALQFAHEEGILHRDIKPENILLDTKGRIKVADFGIGKLIAERTEQVKLTASGMAVGTPHYMAPEQLETPRDVDQRADIYSLGVVFYEMLTGELPIGRFAPPSEKSPVNPQVDPIVLRALEKAREKRFQSASEIKTSVESLRAGTPGGPPLLPANVPPATGVSDFILCNPRLPRMAQAICVYGLLIIPATWVISMVTLKMPESPNAFATLLNTCSYTLLYLGDAFASLLFFVGALRLRSLKPSGLFLFQAGVWIHIAVFLLATTGLIWAEIVHPSPDEVVPLGEAVYAATGMLAMAFEIAALIWVRRNRARLESMCQSVAISQAADANRQWKWSRKAIVGAALGGISLVFGLGWVAVAALLAFYLAGGVGGVSWAEVGASFVVILLCGGGALAALLLGLMARREILESSGHLRGKTFAWLAILTLPAMVLATVILVPVGWFAATPHAQLRPTLEETTNSPPR